MSELLAEALRLVEERPRTAGDLAVRIGAGLKERLADRLAERGVLERRVTSTTSTGPRPVRTFTRRPARVAVTSFPGGTAVTSLRVAPEPAPRARSSCHRPHRRRPPRSHPS